MKFDWKSIPLFLSGFFLFNSAKAMSLPSRKMDGKIIAMRKTIKKKAETGEKNNVISYIISHHPNPGPEMNDQWDSWDTFPNWEAWNVWNTWDTANTWDSWSNWNSADTAKKPNTIKPDSLTTIDTTNRWHNY